MGFIYKYLSELTLKDKSNRFYQLHFFTFPRNSLLFQELILQLASYERSVQSFKGGRLFQNEAMKFRELHHIRGYSP